MMDYPKNARAFVGEFDVFCPCLPFFSPNGSSPRPPLQRSWRRRLRNKALTDLSLAPLLSGRSGFGLAFGLGVLEEKGLSGLGHAASATQESGLPRIHWPAPYGGRLTRSKSSSRFVPRLGFSVS
jgi:hypothetical protein